MCHSKFEKITFKHNFDKKVFEAKSYTHRRPWVRVKKGSYLAPQNKKFERPSKQ